MNFCLDDSWKERKQNEQLDIQEAFQKFDADGDGLLRRDDMRLVMLGLGVHLTEDELTEVMDEANPAEQGQINFEEFNKVMMREDQGPAEEWPCDVTTHPATEERKFSDARATDTMEGSNSEEKTAET